MTSTNPFSLLNLSGHADTRGVTLALPVDRVQEFLPAGLELGAQDITPPGTHPVVLFFHDVFRAQMSIPTLLPSMTYHELSVGVPFSYISPGSLTPGRRGPYYYMPKLYLDNYNATLGGQLFWGLTKEMASIEVTADRYAITSLTGQSLASLEWKKDAAPVYLPVADYPNFAPILRMLAQQPLISQVPAAVGPFLILSDFERNWDVATMRPMRTALEVDVAFIPGFECARYPASGWSQGIDKSVLGSYALRAPWRLGLPYPPLLSFGQ